MSLARPAPTPRTRAPWRRREPRCDIRDLRTQQALVSLSPRARQRLVHGTLADLPDRPAWPVLRATVIAWCESGFNLVEAAAALNVHRTTLLYRLGKIERLLGRPWRDHRAMLTPYVACLSDQQRAKVAPPTQPRSWP